MTKPWEFFPPHLDMSLDIQNAIMQSQLTPTKSFFFFLVQETQQRELYQAILC